MPINKSKTPLAPTSEILMKTNQKDYNYSSSLEGSERIKSQILFNLETIYNPSMSHQVRQESIEALLLYVHLLKEKVHA